ncbi:aspartyl-phosphate phosphatase Spo0E family protein [Halalkalibacter kiskunsagensis]|uniref:Aspartyl-phosphate phosphatase Spo0E family protein n=1 Tax=Halalkalibacter kiskunsagensis TaxID=1548599 RepID=A0ABV6KEI8_9BACI
MKIQQLIMTNLEDKIESLRLRMIATGEQKGLTHSETIKYSQKLDGILNEYSRINAE